MRLYAFVPQIASPPRDNPIAAKPELMKILLIGPLPPPVGGAAVLFNLLVQELQSSPSCQVDVISFSIGQRHGNLKKITKLLTTTLKVTRSIRRMDIVAFNGVDRRILMNGMVVFLLTRLFRKPLLIRAFGGSLDLFYQRGGVLRRYLLGRLFRAEAVLLETRQLMDFFNQTFDAANLIWFPNSRPLRPSTALEASCPPDTVKFVFMSHVKPSKGIFEILQATRWLPDKSFQVDVYGPLLDGISTAHFSGYHRIRYRGSLAPQDVMSTLSAYDVLLLPSYHQGEGYPGAIIEAYMLSMPVVASRWRSIPELVEDGVSGLLVEPKNAQALADAMQQIIDNPTLLLTLRHGARQQAERFSSAIWNHNRFLEICLKTIETFK